MPSPQTESPPSPLVVPSRPEIDKDPLAVLKLAESEEEARYIFAREPRAWWAYFLDIELEPFQVEFILAAEKYHRLLGEWPAGHGKSTNMSWGYPVWHVARNPNVRIMQLGKTTEEMDAYALLERNTLEKNERLLQWYGAFRASTPAQRRLQPWSANGINVAQRQINDPHNTIEWFGSNSDAALGHRTDIIIIDDVVTPDTAGTPERRSKLLYRFREQWQTAPQYRFAIKPAPVTPYPITNPEDGEFRGYLQVPKNVYWPIGVEYEKIIVVGTVFHHLDLYHVLEKDPTFHFIRHDCFVKNADGVLDSLWPNRWSLAKLETERKSQGLLSFNRRYRNICTSEEDLAFKEIYFEGGEEGAKVYPGCLDKTRSFGEFPVGPSGKVGEDPFNVLCSLDPASGTKSNDATTPSLVVCGYFPGDPLRKRYLLDIWSDYSSYHGILDTVERMQDLYEFDLFVVEKNAYGTWLMDDDEPSIQRLKAKGVRIVSHWTGNNKKDPDWGVKSMEPFFMDGLWSFPYKTSYDQKKLEPYYEQFKLYPQALTDYCMATWFADLQIRKGRQESIAFKPSGRRIRTRRNIDAEIESRRKRREERERSTR